MRVLITYPDLIGVKTGQLLAGMPGNEHWKVMVGVAPDEESAQRHGLQEMALPYNDATALMRAFAAVDQVFVTPSGNEQRDLACINAAMAAKIAMITVLSVVGAQHHTHSHYLRLEAQLAKAQVPTLTLRIGILHEELLSKCEGNVLVLPCDDADMFSPIAADDVAVVAAHVIMKHDAYRETQELNLVGPQLMTARGVASEISQFKRDPVQFVPTAQIDDERWLALKNPIETHDVKQILRREAESFETFLKGLYAEP